MKKLLTLVAALALAGSAFALDFAVGARGNFNMALGTTYGDEMKDLVDSLKDSGSSVTYPLVVGGGFGVWGHVGFLDFSNLTLGATLEFGMNFNNGKAFKMDAEGSTIKTVCYAHAIDIPLMITLKVPVGKTVKFDFGLGPNFSIPFGAAVKSAVGASEVSIKLKDGEGVDKVVYNMNIGLVFDADVGFKVGPGYVLVDLRYLLDFTPTTAKVTYSIGSGVNSTEKGELFYRRSLNIGVGYEFCF